MAIAIDILKFRRPKRRSSTASPAAAWPPTVAEVDAAAGSPSPVATPPGWRGVAARAVAGLGKWRKTTPASRVERRPVRRAVPTVRWTRSPQGITSWPARLVRAVVGPLLLDVKVERRGGALHIVIGRKAAPRTSTTAEKAIAEAASQRRALRRLLNHHSLTRRMLPHLAHVEKGLTTEGLSALASMPLEVLSVALGQLDAIVSNWSDRDLADIRSRMAVALKERTQELSDDFASPGGERSDLMPGSRLMIDEVTHSVFMELERQYEAVLPRESIHAVLGPAETAPDSLPEVTCELANGGDAGPASVPAGPARPLPGG